MLKAYLIALVVFLAIDALWLGFIARNLYRDQIGHLLAENANLIAAGVFYLIFIFGLVYFVIDPGMSAGSYKEIVVPALLYGFITYSTYDLTNLATLKDWPIFVTIVDICWGMFISLSVSLITYFVIK